MCFVDWWCLPGCLPACLERLRCELPSPLLTGLTPPGTPPYQSLPSCRMRGGPLRRCVLAGPRCGACRRAGASCVLPCPPKLTRRRAAGNHMHGIQLHAGPLAGRRAGPQPACPQQGSTAVQSSCMLRSKWRRAPARRHLCLPPSCSAAVTRSGGLRLCHPDQHNRGCEGSLWRVERAVGRAGQGRHHEQRGMLESLW